MGTVCEKIRTNWGWVVCFSNFTLTTLLVGTIYGFGEFIIPIQQELHYSMIILGKLTTVKVVYLQTGVACTEYIHNLCKRTVKFVHGYMGSFANLHWNVVNFV